MTPAGEGGAGKSLADSMARDVLEWKPSPAGLVTRELWTDEFKVNFGPQHPSTHGVLRLIVTLDGEIVKHVELSCGYLHRGIEKIAENRSALQIIPFTDRVDYVAAMNSNHAVSLAAEKLMGIEVPERGQVLRVIMAELNRIASHLLWWGDIALNLGAVTPFFYAFRERELILDLFEEACGQRLTYNYIRPGGVSHDIPAGWEERCTSAVKAISKRLPEYHRLLTNNAVFQMRMRGVGVISAEEAIEWGLSGPTLRGSGVRFDVRKSEPYDVYGRLKFDIPVGKRGDCFDRYMVRMNEIEQSLSMVEQCLAMLPSSQGPHAKKLGMTARIPEGEVLARTEAPRGEMSVYMRGNGSAKPWRMKLRTASFANLAVLDRLSRGAKIADLIAIFGSLDVVVPEVDR